VKQGKAKVWQVSPPSISRRSLEVRLSQLEAQNSDKKMVFKEINTPSYKKSILKVNHILHLEMVLDKHSDLHSKYHSRKTYNNKELRS